MWCAWMNVCLLLLCIWRILHLSMFYVLSFRFRHYMLVHVHGAIFPEVFDGLVASSSSVRGSGTLQYGIRANVVAWAWMGHERSASRGRLPSSQHKTEENLCMTREFWKIPLSIGIIRSLEDLVWSPANASDHLSGRSSDGDHRMKFQKFF